MSLCSAPGSVLIKTILLKSLQRRCSQHPDLALIKTSTDNSCWQTARQSNFQSLYTSGKAYGNLVLVLHGVKKPPYMASAFLGKSASTTAVDSNPAEEIRFLKVFGI